jgi:iron complex outermembrane recepter protein
MLQKLIFCFVLLLGFNAFSQYKVDGEILDDNNNPIAGCHIHIGTKITTSDTFGKYTIFNLKKGKVKIFVSSLGYKSIIESLVVNGDIVFNIKMIPFVNELEEVSISHKKNTQNVSILEQKIKTETIEKYSNKTLGDALKEVAGVSILRTGSNIVKPVINGLHSSRVPIISNNVRLEDQQWGSEHAPNFDINSAGKITIIKGASSLQYGGDVIGGLVLIEPLEVKKDTLFGKTIANLSSNGKGGTLSSSIHRGNFCDWSWNALGTFKYFGDRNAADYVLSNSGNRELNFSGDIKYIGKRYDASIFYSLYNAQIGILRASHTGNVTDLYNSITNLTPSVIKDFTYNLVNPKQEVKHHLVKANFNSYFNDDESLAVQYSFQFNKRLEFDIRRASLNNIAALDLELVTHSLRIDYKLNHDQIVFKAGINANIQDNTPNRETKVRPLIPKYNKTDFGIYAISNYSISESLTWDAGIRYDFSNIKANKFYFKSRWEERGYTPQFSNFIIGENDTANQWLTTPAFTFHNFSGSLGIRKEFAEDWNWYINVSLATRNPNPSEFFSDGLHHATGQIELGDLALQKESSCKFSTTVQKKWTSFLVEMNPYINRISNYIFLRPIGFETTIRGAFPVWQYEQTQALLTGLDFHTQWDVTKFWKHQFTFATVNGIDQSKGIPLIAMPPVNFSNKIQFSKKEWSGLFIELKNEVVLRQTNFPDNNFTTNIVQNDELIPVLVDISSSPKAYQLWDFYTEMKFKSFKTATATVSFSIQNILNTNYRDYLNSQRFFADELGRNFQIQLKYNY